MAGNEVILLLLICFHNSRADSDLFDDTLFCADDEFRCNNEKCIAAVFRCDSFPDCQDESDEIGCSYQNIGIDCKSPDLLCDGKCISAKKLCDGKKDCEFGEDELNCKNPSECEFGSCSHFCENQNQKNDTKIVCKCAPGYIILEDGFNCQSNATDEPFLIYTNRYDIRMNRFQRKNESYSLEAETQSLPLVSHLRNAIDLDYFFNHTDGSALIFWSDISLDQIFCGRLHQGILNDVHPIVSFGVWTAENLAVDWIGLHIYWIDSQLGHILVSNFDGSMVTTLISGNMGNLRALAIDPSVGLLFWTDWLQTNPRIEMATMSGNNRKVLYQIKDNGGWANGLACDYISRRLYWVDAKSDSIHTINYDGTDKRQIIHDAIHLAHPFSIDVFENNVFFSDWRSKSLYRVNKWTGLNLETIVEESINQPFGLKIVHSSRQVQLSNPCLNHTCSHLCLIESRTRYKCACPYLYVLDKDDRNLCVSINQTLLVASRNTIAGIDIDQPMDTTFPVLSLSKDNITAIGVYEAKSIVYWADSNSNSIHLLELNGSSRSQPRLFIKSDATNCHGIAVDNALGQVYYSGWTRIKAWIKVASFDGKLRKTVISSTNNPMLKEPQQLVYSNGKLYWFDGDKLFQATANGAKVTQLKELNINVTKNAFSLAIDNKERLIWTQPHLNITRMLDLQTMNLHTLKVENVSLVAVDSFSGEFILYDERNGNISARFSDETNGFRLKNSTRLLRSNIHQRISMKFMEHDASLDYKEEQDHCKSLGCTHFCLLSFEDRKCACADGYLNDKNNCVLPESRLLLLNAEYDIFWISTDQSLIANVPIVSNSTSLNFQPRYFALNSKSNILYFIDTKNELWEFDMTTNNLKKMLEGGNSRLSSVAVDIDTGYVYVSSYSPTVPLKPLSSIIQVLHPIYGDLRKDIVFLISTTSSSLEIDSKAGFIFWITLDGISRSRLDGSDIQKVLKQNRYVSKIVLDRQSKRILYLNMTATVIYSINYDGSDQKTFPPLFNSTTKTQPPFESITVTNGLLYFTIQRQLKSVKLSNGLPLIDTNRLVANLTSTTLSIQTISSDDGKTKSLCSTKNCEQFCFNFGDHAKCDCAYSRLSKNGQSCERFASFIAFASGSKVEFTTTFDEQQDYKNISIDNELNRYEVQALKPIESFLKAPVAISVDTDRKVLFVSDIQTEQIVAIPFNQTQRIVISQNIRRVEGLAYDSHNKHLYLSSEKSIQRVNVSNLDEKILKHPEIVLELNRYDLVRGLAVNPCEGILYFTNWGLHTPAIEQVYFNGSGRHAIITTDIQTPNAVTVDYTAKKLYWLDARLDKIERMDYDGSNREVVLSAPINMSMSMSIWSTAYPAHPFALSIYGNRLYYTDWIHRSVLSVDKLLANDVTIHRGNMAEQPMGLAIVAEDLPLCGQDECSMGKLECGDKCVLDAEGISKCACKKGRELNADLKTCKDIITCRKDELKCDNQLECYTDNQKCDGKEDCQDGSDELDCPELNKDPCLKMCLNGGTCKLDSALIQCNCPEEFTGLFCEIKKCDGFCSPNGKCSINTFTGLPECTCNFGYKGHYCDEKADFCDGFCYNNGTCHEASNGIHCTCTSTHFYGIRCQNCDHSISGRPLICKNEGYCDKNRIKCVCPERFDGLECEEDICGEFACLNGGVCKRSKMNTPYCECKSSFDGSRCELDFCGQHPNHCKNGGICVHSPGDNISVAEEIKCLCPSKFHGNHCEHERSCSDYCLNGASCISKSYNEFECHCSPDYFGPRCEHHFGCGLDCAYGECVKIKDNVYKCNCPPGIGLLVDYVGHKSCSKVIAKRCTGITCVKGECFEMVHNNTTTPECICEDGFTGLLCDLPSCYNYCAEGSECSVMDNHPYCKCAIGQFGPRCNQAGFIKLPSTPKSRSMFILLPLILLIFAITTVGYFAVLKRHNISFIGVQRQFQHKRMLDDELATEFQNPAFTQDDENIQSELVNSHLIETTGVYNDTILRSANSAEQFNLLSKRDNH